MSHPQPYGYPALPTQTQVLVQPYRCSTAHVVLAWVLAVLTGLYLLPWAVAATRNRPNVGATALVNLFLGWTVVGWVVALVMACGSERLPVVGVQTYGPPQPPWTPQQWPPQQWPPQQWSSAQAQLPPQHWEQAPPQPRWTPPQPWYETRPPALPPAPPRPSSAAAEPTRIDPFGAEPTQQLPRSPWEPDHLR